jgi:hypothetical protein
LRRKLLRMRSFTAAIITMQVAARRPSATGPFPVLDHHYREFPPLP